MKNHKTFKFASEQLKQDWAKLVELTGSTKSGIMNELAARLNIPRQIMSAVVHGHKKADAKVFTKIEAFINAKIKLYEAE